MPNSEDLVAAITTKMFFQDFVVKNPKYIKGGTLEKEAADVLVPFKDTLLVFQIKSKHETKPASERSPHEFERISRRIEKGIAQIGTIKDALMCSSLTHLETMRGIRIPFDRGRPWSIVGVVVYDILGEENLPPDERTWATFTAIEKKGIPIHVFSRHDFEAIATEIDTMPDFLHYLEVRWRLVNLGVLHPFTDELSFLVFFKTRYADIERCLAGEINMLMLDETIWDHYVREFASERDQRRRNLRPSYLIDDMIGKLHLSIGFQPPGLDIAELFGDTSRAPSCGTIDGYQIPLVELASMCRLARKMVGERLIEKMRKADQTTRGYAIFLGEGDECPILILAMKGDRVSRSRELANLCAAALCLHGLKRILGIATEEWSVTRRSYDFLYFQDVEFENSQDLARLGARLFGRPKRSTTNEWENVCSKKWDDSRPRSQGRARFKIRKKKRR